MDKILVVEVGRVMTTATLFNLDMDELRFGGQKVTITPVKETQMKRNLTSAADSVRKITTAMLEVIKGVLSQGGEVDPPSLKAFYILVSSSEWGNDFQELQELQENLGLTKSPEILTNMDTSSAVMDLGKHLLHEVGGFLIVDVGGGSVTVYSAFNLEDDGKVLEWFTKASDLGIYDNAIQLVAGIGEEDIEKRYGQQWKHLIKLVPNTAEEITLAAELTAQAVREVLTRHLHHLRNTDLDLPNRNLHDTNLRAEHKTLKVNWIIGTGRALVELPNGMQALRDGLEHVTNLGHPLSIVDTPILMDREGVLHALGVLIRDYTKGSWELLLQSLSVDS